MVITLVTATVLLLMMMAVAAHNAVNFPHIERVPPPMDGALPPATDLLPVSILIPARNESANIAHVIADLLAQDYPCFELIVLDDNSEDDTFLRAQTLLTGHPHAQLLRGTPLPPGWLGKNWACHQLADVARHDRLLFVDADVRWDPGALRALMTHAHDSQADLLTVWPTQITVTWSERLVVPLMSFILLAYLPIAWAHDARMRAAVAANGQCLLFRRAAYLGINGHHHVRSSVLDDVHLAYAVKQAGYRLRMVDGGGLISCRMYHGWQSVIEGYTKNILAAHGSSTPGLLVSTLLHLGIFVAPFPLLLWTWFNAPLWVALWAAVLIALGMGIRGLTAHTAGLRVRDALLMPISVLILAAIALHAIWARYRHGGPSWKGHRITPHFGENP